MAFWRTILAWLATLAADPVQIDAEAPRSAAAVAAAYASMRPADPTPAPTPPRPEECPCKGRCQGGRYQPDGNVWQPCVDGCKSCKVASVLAPATPCKCGGDCSPKCSCGCQCRDGKCPRAGGGG